MEFAEQIKNQTSAYKQVESAYLVKFVVGCNKFLCCKNINEIASKKKAKIKIQTEEISDFLGEKFLLF